MGRRRRGVALALMATCFAGPQAAEADWSHPVHMSASGFNQRGKATWTHERRVVALVNHDREAVLTAYASPGAGPFSKTGRIAPEISDEAYALAPLPGGGVVAIYLSDDGLFVTGAAADGRFGQAERVADRTQVVSPRLVVGERGDVLVLWTSPRCQVGCEPVSAVWAAVRPAGAARFDASHQLSSPDGSSGWARGAIDPQGNVLVTWLTGPADEDSLEGNHLTYALRPAGGQFSPGAPVGPDIGIVSYRLAKSEGRVALIWNGEDRRPVRVATGSVMGGFGPPVSLGGPSGRTARVALDRQDGFVAWTEERRGHQRLLRVASLRPDGPAQPRTIERAKVRRLEVRAGARGRRLVTWGERRNYRVSLHAAVARRGLRFRPHTVDARETYGYESAATTDGSFILTWLTSRRYLSVAHAAVARAGRGFGPVTHLAGDRRHDAGVSRLAVGPGGRALAWWNMSSERTAVRRIEARYWRP